ncbi:MAG TPA: helix-turn-helix domain-containing protein [Spirochaetes bacterium]|nr:helix-turn-helix domain-containing protein [Spirochaetota bacterium]
MDNNLKINEIMTLSEVAGYLKLSEKTVLRMVHKDKIPCAKIASQWRFVRSVIDDWLISKMKVVPKNDLARVIESGSPIVPLSRLIKKDLIVMDIKPGTKNEVLEQLARPVLRNGTVHDASGFLEKLMHRERMATTAIGKGVAIPHMRNPRENPISGPALVIGICKAGTDFEALDKKKTYLFFFICTDSEVIHLRVMGKLAGLMRDEITVSRLIESNGRDVVLKIILEKEQDIMSQELLYES